MFVTQFENPSFIWHFWKLKYFYWLKKKKNTQGCVCVHGQRKICCSCSSFTIKDVTGHSSSHKNVQSFSNTSPGWKNSSVRGEEIYWFPCSLCGGNVLSQHSRVCPVVSASFVCSGCIFSVLVCNCCVLSIFVVCPDSKKKHTKMYAINAAAVELCFSTCALLFCVHLPCSINSWNLTATALKPKSISSNNSVYASNITQLLQLWCYTFGIKSRPNCQWFNFIRFITAETCLYALFTFT